jgi:hypothetical protein
MPRHAAFTLQCDGSGNDGQKMFLKTADHGALLENLVVVRQRYPFYFYAYVLMLNPLYICCSRF